MSQINAAKDDNGITQVKIEKKKKKQAKLGKQSAAFRATAAKRRTTIMRVKDGI